MLTDSKTYPSKICIPDKNGFKLVKRSQITHLKAHGNYTLIYLADTTQVVATGCIKEYEKLLPAPAFIRVHKSYIVHTEYIKPFSGDGIRYVELYNGNRIAVSRRRKTYFMDCMKQTTSSP